MCKLQISEFHVCLICKSPLCKLSYSYVLKCIFVICLLLHIFVIVILACFSGAYVQMLEVSDSALSSHYPFSDSATVHLLRLLGGDVHNVQVVMMLDRQPPKWYIMFFRYPECWTFTFQTVYMRRCSNVFPQVFNFFQFVIS